MKILLIGNGKWGKNYVNTIHTFFSEILLEIATRDNWEAKINEDPDGVIISTPPDSHIKIAKCALMRKIPVIIEKPLCLSLIEARELEKFSNIPIIVNHIHLFSDRYQEIKNISKNHKIKSIISRGYNNGPIRNNYSSLWDYGPHELSMILDLLDTDLPNINAEEIIYGNGTSLINLNIIINDLIIKSEFGNGSSVKERSLEVKFGGIDVPPNFIYDENYNKNNPPLQNMLKVFFDALDGNIKDYRLGLGLSFRVLEALEKIEREKVGNNKLIKKAI